jgi:hypothetical protein
LRRRIGGGVAAAAKHRGRRGQRPFAPFAVAHAAGRPVAAPAFWGEKLSAILRVRTAGVGEWDRPTGTSEHTNRASDLLRKES